MKHIIQLSIIAVYLCCSVAVYAQEQRNKSFQVIINNVVYTQKEQKTRLDNVLGVAAQAILTGREYMNVTVANIATTSRTVVETIKEKKDGKETERKVTNTYHKGIIDVTLQMNIDN